MLLWLWNTRGVGAVEKVSWVIKGVRLPHRGYIFQKNKGSDFVIAKP